MKGASLSADLTERSGVMSNKILKTIRVAAGWIQTILAVRLPMDRANGLHTR